MRFGFVLGLILSLAMTAGMSAAYGQPGAGPTIAWEVKNRFRLFRSEADFMRHVAAHGDSVLASEQRLARETDGRGWARDTVERLCVDRAGKLLDLCDRDGERESYLSPRDHRVGVSLAGTMPPNESCVWNFDDGEGAPRNTTAPCVEEVKLRVRYGKPTVATVDIVLLDGTAQRVVSEIQVRDVLIAGMGDSVAAGEGNPDRAVRLSDEGFCFRRLNGSEYFRPGRAGFNGNKTCSVGHGDEGSNDDWGRQSARWMSGGCHRSLYSYQLRAALTLAIETPHVAVTFLPLACSGATVDQGFLGTLRARECPSPGTGAACPTSVPSQIGELTSLLATARRQRPDRPLDLVLLTIGANDILFSGLIADVFVEPGRERTLMTRGGALATVENVQKIFEKDLPVNFARVRAALKPLVGGNLNRVVYVTYGNPALIAPDTPCPGGRLGFDVHPAFAANGERLRRTIDFVSKRFLPGIKAMALCQEGNLCRDPASERMTFVDAHQTAFASHGVCAQSDDDPVFDRECFSSTGETFQTSLAKGATDPLVCHRVASEFRPYAPRTRWVRTANDSYLTAMTYPEALPVTLQPADLHDAMWGIYASVYGGAVHPTAEGHAAMADATLPAVREVLAMPQAATAPVRVEPLRPAEPLRPPQDISTPRPTPPN